MSDPNRTVPVQIDQLRQMERQLAEHARRAALVAEWAEGLRAGTRYVLPDNRGTTYSVLESKPEKFLVFADGGHCEVLDAGTAATFMAVSDQWQEVE